MYLPFGATLCEWEQQNTYLTESTFNPLLIDSSNLLVNIPQYYLLPLAQVHCKLNRQNQGFRQFKLRETLQAQRNTKLHISMQFSFQHSCRLLLHLPDVERAQTISPRSVLCRCNIQRHPEIMEKQTTNIETSRELD